MKPCSGASRLAVLAICLSVLSASRCGLAGAQQAGSSPFPFRYRVPPLPANLTWLNTAGPLELSDFRGKFVLLDFWTYCCINCMHILPELEKLEKAYANQLVVVGVHSAKFETERDAKNINEAILRYHIRHPVINDADRQVWNLFKVNAWPTLYLIDPEGYAIWGTSGQITAAELDVVLRKALPIYRAKGVLDERPLHFDAAAAQTEPTPLRFPGKIVADEASSRLYIADSGHQRIVVASMDGQLIETIGTGQRGRADGGYDEAQFNDPQGMALLGNKLFVADNHNHLIRQIDLAARQVRTIAGTGAQIRTAPPTRAGRADRMALSSPWDLWLVGTNDLYIAMAGTHQIWRMDLAGGVVGPYAGNAREDIIDGPLLPRQPYQADYASFAQPSGLASDGRWLFVADSEGSSVRAVPLDPKMEVRTVVGTAQLTGGRLFTFGDVDGPVAAARLQHPLAVAYAERRIYVADTYNNKIKAIDLDSRTVSTIAGSSDAGLEDEPPQFDEPAGLSLAAGKLWVADTNNHAVRSIDLRDNGRVSTIKIDGLEPPPPPDERSSSDLGNLVSRVRMRPTTVRVANNRVTLRVQLALPAGIKLNPLAPMSYALKPAEQASPLIAGDAYSRRVRVSPPTAAFDVIVPVTASTGKASIIVELTYYYCQEGKEALCKIGAVEWLVPLELSPQGAASALLSFGRP